MKMRWLGACSQLHSCSLSSAGPSVGTPTQVNGERSACSSSDGCWPFAMPAQTRCAHLAAYSRPTPSKPNQSPRSLRPYCVRIPNAKSRCVSASHARERVSSDRKPVPSKSPESSARGSNGPIPGFLCLPLWQSPSRSRLAGWSANSRPLIPATTRLTSPKAECILKVELTSKQERNALWAASAALRAVKVSQLFRPQNRVQHPKRWSFQSANGCFRDCTNGKMIRRSLHDATVKLSGRGFTTEPFHRLAV
ncbi:hypothetical protein N658DRAFT_300449 [Parathielavia hyrcaniae]|uniref:Uncharacterized protein n=1 Tax=Parathielavia hyrcaniae TaxID=113614 RepID=A0AAN6Q6F5_9PEZI|nr:hypothetical protein N658DRAFT_300449 [Parathielavia hyrcaniae]